MGLVEAAGEDLHQRHLVRSAVWRIRRPVQWARRSRSAACSASSMMPETVCRRQPSTLARRQFAARFDLTLTPETQALCRSMPLDDLRPSASGVVREVARGAALDWSRASNSASSSGSFLNCMCLVGCVQEPGSIGRRRLGARTGGRSRRARVGNHPRPQRLTDRRAVCHDFSRRPRRSSTGASLHRPRAGVAPASRFLDRLNAHSPVKGRRYVRRCSA